MNAQYKTFEYHFRDQKLYEDYYCLCSIGREYRTDPSYFFDCRNVSERQCVFQYTVSGEGCIDLGRQRYTLRKGQAFLIEKPGPYLYYLPKGSDHWEIIFLALNLSSISVWRDLTEKYGRIVDIQEDSSVMQYWNELYELSLRNEMDNFFKCSAYAYSFMMYLNDTLQKNMGSLIAGNVVLNCANIIHSRYQEDLSLPYLASLCGVSETQLSKKFKISYKMSPIQYLIRHRIDVACSILLRSREKIEEVALKVGFKDANYFTRMFKKQLGVTPKEYRKREYTRTVHSSANQHILLTKAPKNSGED